MQKRKNYYFTRNKLTQRMALNDAASSWQLVTNSVPQGSVLGPVLFKIFLGHLYKGMEGTVSKFPNSKLDGSVDLLKGRKALLRDVDRLDQRADTNGMVFNNTKCWVLYLHQQPHAVLQDGAESLENCPVKEDQDCWFTVAEHKPA